MTAVIEPPLISAAETGRPDDRDRQDRQRQQGQQGQQDQRDRCDRQVQPDRGDRLARLDDFELVEAMRSARRAASRAVAEELSLLAELESRRLSMPEVPGSSLAAGFLVDEVAAALTLTQTAAVIRLQVATRLHRLPLTRAALADGRIDFDRARILCDLTADLDPDTAKLIDAALQPQAEHLTTGQLRDRTRRAVQTVDPDAFADRRARAERSRRVQLWHTDEGTIDLAGRDLPSTEAHAAMN